jgi:hypothetical protein
MKSALFFGLALFVSCWLVHFVIWRIRRPEAYPVWLPIIFYLVPAITGVLMAVFGSPIALPTAPSIFAGTLLHAVISACYMGGYAGIIEYSPSAEVLRVVRAAGPEGLLADALKVNTLSEAALTGKRIRHLATSGMAETHDGTMKLSPRGNLIVGICLVYRRLFNLTSDARG